jgi:hypothetical protein
MSFLRPIQWYHCRAESGRKVPLKIFHKNTFVGISINPSNFPLTKAGLFNGIPKEADISVEAPIYPSQILLYLLQLLGFLSISLSF